MSLQPGTIDRLFHLFNEGHELTQADIARHLGITDRQVRRLLDQLRDGGVALKERRDGKSKVYFIDPADRKVESRDGLQFEERELFALTIAANAARALLGPTPLDAPLATAYDKLVAQYADSVLSFEPESQRVHWFFESSAHPNIDFDVFEALMRALTENRSVYIDYYSASKDKLLERQLIDPYVIAVRGSSWLLVAYEHEGRNLVDYSLAGIRRLKPSDSFFTQPDDFDPELHFRYRFSALRGENDYVVRLSVEPSKAPYFRRKTYHPTQLFEEEHEDGSLIVSYEVSGLDEIASFIRSWGPGVLVLDPPELAERLAGEALEIARQYQSAKSG
jgi:predicted DNA-binding transcriptional regulator YafY